MKRKEDKRTVTSIELKNIPKSFPDCIDRRDLYNLVGVIRFLGRPGDEKKWIGQLYSNLLKINQMARNQ